MSDVFRFKEYKNCDSDICISVFPQYVDEQSSPKDKIFTFSYSVNIESMRETPVKLINRHWRIFSAGVQIQDVKGMGVVGEQPTINPREEYQYSSFAQIRDSFGQMQGTFTFFDQTSGYFDIRLPDFDLIYNENQTLH